MYWYTKESVPQCVGMWTKGKKMLSFLRNLRTYSLNRFMECDNFLNISFVYDNVTNLAKHNSLLGLGCLELA